MWSDQPFSQRNTTTVRAVGVGGDRKEEEGGGQILKNGGRQYKGGVFIK